jgi:FMN phosphatase YigB (HAD superfamily)
MLHIFDLDRTLVVMYGIDPLPRVPDRLAALVAAGHRMAVATNQAGPAWGLETGDPKFPKPESLPERFRKVAARISELARVPWFVAVGDPRLSLTGEDYRTLVERVLLGAGALDLHISAAFGWRKPAPGMLLAACATFDVSPSQAIYVGDADSDAEAAERAGMAFAWADAFFRLSDDGAFGRR